MADAPTKREPHHTFSIPAHKVVRKDMISDDIYFGDFDTRPMRELHEKRIAQRVELLKELGMAEPNLTEAQQRKQHPMYSGVLAYFPDALDEVSYVSFVGNQQHNPGEPLHWAKEKSTDEPDCILRHLKDHASGNKYDDDGVRHLAKVAWRALAFLQRTIDKEKSNGQSGS